MKTQRILGNLVVGVVIGALAVGSMQSTAHAQGAKPTATATTTAKPPTPAGTTTAKPPTPAGTTTAGAKPPTPTGTAPAANDPKALYADGEKKFKAGDFAGALPSFMGAESIKAAPQAERYIGLCHDNLGHYADAVSYYEKFLAAVPPKMTKEGDEIKARVATIKAMPGKVHIESTPPGASILVDGKQMGNAPADIELTPGKHIVKLELAGYLPIDKDLDVGYGSKQEVKSELVAKPAEPPPVAANPTPPVTDKPAEPAKPPEPPKEPRSKVPAFITGGLAVAAVGVGTVFGILALGKQSSFKDSPNADTADTGENFALVADMSFGIAITLGVTSLVLFLTNDDEPAKPAAAALPAKKAQNLLKNFTIAPIVTTSGGGAGASFRF